MPHWVLARPGRGAGMTALVRNTALLILRLTGSGWLTTTWCASRTAVRFDVLAHLPDITGLPLAGPAGEPGRAAPC
jgi:hypothetical protein